jgi:transglutaminase-like putative cysteine protease
MIAAPSTATEEDMTTLRIEHHTTYLYARPVHFGRHRLVLRPREGHDVRVVEMTLDIRPAHRLAWSRDVFGNSVAIVDFTEPSDRLEIFSRVVVERTSPYPIEMPHAALRVPFPVVYDPLETTIAGAYQTPSYPDDADELRDWLERDLPADRRTDGEQAIFALGEVVNGRIKYLRRNEKGVQTPSQTLQLGSGSCRDMATLMMDAARTLGLAARFASGYLHCMASEAGRASTHAWTEVYLPTVGWHGYDPTLGAPTSLKHVVTGVSNHPRGVMPVSGMFHGASSDYREMTVEVRTERIASGESANPLH